MVTADAPVGVFDSGIGGLSTLREIRRRLPSEDLLYVADSGYAPYGDKPVEYVQARSNAIVEFLKGRGAKAVVVACNTATAIAVDTLRAEFDLPIIAIEPAVKPAVARTRSHVIGVLGTTQTLSTRKFATLVQTHAGDVQVLPQPCPGLVEQIEAGQFSSQTTRALVEKYVRPLLERGADAIVLGCTHYSFLTAAIQEVAGPGVAVVDSAEAVANEVRRRLESHKLLARGPHHGKEEFWTTGPLDRVQALIAQLWSVDAKVHVM